MKEKYVWASIHKARTIDPENVTLLDQGPDGRSRALVKTIRLNENDKEIVKVHIVENYQKDDCTCTCGHSEQGNTCKHQVSYGEFHPAVYSVIAESIPGSSSTAA